MKKLKLFFILTSVIFFISGLGYAQLEDVAKSIDTKARETTDGLNKALQFTEEQNNMVYGAYKEYYTAISSLGNSFLGNITDVTRLKEDANNQLLTTMKNILTPSQLDKFITMQTQDTKSDDSKINPAPSNVSPPPQQNNNGE